MRLSICNIFNISTRALRSVVLWIGILLLLFLFFAVQFFRHDYYTSKHFQKLLRETATDGSVNRNSHMTNGIPRIIHQTWKTADIPVRWMMAQQTWKLQTIAYSLNKTRLTNLEFKYYFWNDTSLDQFVRAKFPWFLSTYLSYQYDIQRVDAARYVLLYYYGGIYADLDVGCSRKGMLPLLKSLTDEEGVVLFETEPYGFTNDVIISKRRHPFMRHVIAGLAESNRNYLLPYLTVMFTTGPVFFSKRFSSYSKQDEIVTLPMAAYEPTYVFHVGGGSWHYFDSKIIWWCYSNISPISVFVIVVLFVTVLILYKRWKKKSAITR